MEYKDKFQDKNITLYNMDCMELLKNTEDNFYDLAIVDPEYGIGADKPSSKPNRVKQKNGSTLNIKSVEYKHKDWDNKPAGFDYLQELKRVSKNQIIWGCNYYNFPLMGGRIVWDKLNGKSDQFGCEVAYCSMNKRTDILYYMWAGMMQGYYIGNEVKKALIQQGNKTLNERRIHPTQKPVKLYEWLLINYAKEGNKILDTHLGSGSIAIACNRLKYELTACELDTEYFEGSVKRYKEQTAQIQCNFKIK